MPAHAGLGHRIPRASKEENQRRLGGRQAHVHFSINIDPQVIGFQRARYSCAASIRSFNLVKNSS